MYDLIAENPYVITAMLAFCSLSSFGIWVKTGNRPAVSIGLLLLAVIPVFLWLEQNLVTDKEVLRTVIQELAEAAERGEYEKIYARIDENTGNALASVKAELPRYRLSNARITGYRELTVRSDLSPPEALADFTAVATLGGPGGMHSDSVPRRVRLVFRKFGSEWKIVGYQHLPPVGKTDGYAGSGGELPAWINP